MLSDKFSIRRAATGEGSALALLGAATFLESYAGFLEATDIAEHCATEHSPAAYANYLAQPHTSVFVAAADPGAALIGYAVACPLTFTLADATPADYELKRIYAFHRYHGKGVGHALLQQVTQAARDLGRRRLLLGVNVQNATALRFYTRQGFVRIGARTLQVGHTLCSDDVLALTL